MNVTEGNKFSNITTFVHTSVCVVKVCDVCVCVCVCVCMCVCHMHDYVSETLRMTL